MTDVVVEVQGGLVVGVYASGEDARIVVVDWDDGSDQKSVAHCYPHMDLSVLPEDTRGAYLAATRTSG